MQSLKKKTGVNNTNACACRREMYAFHTGDPQDAQEMSPAPGMRDQFHFDLHSVGFILEHQMTQQDNKRLFRHLHKTKGRTASKILASPLIFNFKHQLETDVLILILRL